MVHPRTVVLAICWESKDILAPSHWSEVNKNRKAIVNVNHFFAISNRLKLKFTNKHAAGHGLMIEHNKCYREFCVLNTHTINIISRNANLSRTLDMSSFHHIRLIFIFLVETDFSVWILFQTSAKIIESLKSHWTFSVK